MRNEKEIEEVTVPLDGDNSKNEKEEFSPIYKVPSRLRDINTNPFVPRVVSIGPLHKGGANLKLMEDMKKTYRDELLAKVGSPPETLSMCMNKVSDSINKIKKCYSEKKASDLPNDKLAEMMVMDACFILHFIYKLTEFDNFLSDNRLRSRSIALDLVLLENQIPFFVLKDIYDLIFKTLESESRPSLSSMLHDLLERVNPFLDKLKLKELSAENPPYHILGLLHEFYNHNTSGPPKIEAILKVHSDSAVGLHKVGVRFRPNQNMSWPLAMDFEQSTLRMPRVLLDNFFEVVMRNLIAYEQYSYGVKNYVASYAMALDMLAATPADVAKLAESDVLVSNLGSYEKALNMISSICKDVTFLDFYYIECWQKVKNHTDSYWSTNYVMEGNCSICWNYTVCCCRDSVCSSNCRFYRISLSRNLTTQILPFDVSFIMLLNVIQIILAA